MIIFRGTKINDSTSPSGAKKRLWDIQNTVLGRKNTILGRMGKWINIYVTNQLGQITHL